MNPGGFASAAAMPPFVPMLIGALALPLLAAPLRRVLCVLAPLLSLALVIAGDDGTSATTTFLGQQIVLVRTDRLARIFGLVFASAAVLANLYGWYRERAGEQVSALLYAGGGLAVVYAGDLLSLLVAWELMAIASAVLVFAGGWPKSIAAGQRYLLVHLAAGSLLLIGVAGWLNGGEAIAFDHLGGRGWPSQVILAAFCINAAVVPLHAWLPDAYPEASVSGSVFLSTFTTKAAVYCLVRGFAGEEVLVPLGALMAVYGVVYATMEDDMRRLLSYHIVSQVGYMVCGIGVGSSLAVNGSVAHAVCHILYKALLFMAAGAIIQGSGRRRLSELGGIGATMPLTFAAYMTGALSISGAPLFNGFVSKSVVVSGAAAEHQAAAVALLTLASVGTFLSVGLKLPYFAFVAPSATAVKTREAPAAMLAAMAILSFLCIGLGIAPGVLYQVLPQPPDYHPYTAYHVFEALLLMTFCGLAFWQLRRRLVPHAGASRDLDELYRLPAAALIARVSRPLDHLATDLGRLVAGLRDRLDDWSRDPTSGNRGAGRIGAPRPWFDEDARRPPLATPLSWVLATLAAVFAAALLRS